MTRLNDIARLASELATFATMLPSQLQKEWRLHFGEEAPDVPPSLLARGLAYKVQADCLGGLSPAGQRMLDKMSLADGQLPEPAIKLKPGSRLIREWQGRLYTVSVNEHDFVLDGRSYGPLSEVARDITGTRWSGPRFFGIKRRPPPPKREASAHG